MADFNIRSDSVDVEDVMRQIRARIREKRGVDYTEQEIRELAAVKLEKFLDPTKLRSDLLEQYRQLQRDQANPDTSLGEEALFGTPRGWLRRLRRLLRPVLKLFLNPVPLERAARVDTVRHAELFFELVHNLVVEITRLGIEVKTLKMRVESISSRLDFDERRARAFEGVVQATPAPRVEEPAPGAGARKEDEEADAETAATRSRRRRRRRGRRGGQRGGAEETGGAVAGGSSAGATAQDTDAPEVDAATAKAAEVTAGPSEQNAGRAAADEADRSASRHAAEQHGGDESDRSPERGPAASPTGSGQEPGS